MSESPVQVSIAKWLFWFHSGIAKEYVDVKFKDKVRGFYMLKAKALIDHICDDTELLKRKETNNEMGKFWFGLQGDINKSNRSEDER